MPIGNDITNMIRFIRVDIGDDGSSETYTDTQIVNMIAKVTPRVDTRIGHSLTVPTSGGYVQFEQATSGSTFLASGTFTLPSGSAESGLPDEFFNVIVLGVECQFAKRGYFDSAGIPGKALRVRDGDTEIDTSVGLGGARGLVESEGGPCAEFNDAIERLIRKLQDEFGGDITDYAQAIWKGNIKRFESHTHTDIHGNFNVEIIKDFTDYLDGTMSGRDHYDTDIPYR